MYCHVLSLNVTHKVFYSMINFMRVFYDRYIWMFSTVCSGCLSLRYPGEMVDILHGSRVLIVHWGLLSFVHVLCLLFHFVSNVFYYWWLRIILRWFNWLTHWGWDKMAAISQTTFSNAFSWMKMHEFRWTFHWNLYLSVKLTASQHWFR